MATCAQCGAKSRDPNEKGNFTLETVLCTTDPLWPMLAGTRLSLSAKQAFRLQHTCGWSIVGYIENGAFIAYRIGLCDYGDDHAQHIHDSQSLGTFYCWGREFGKQPS